jgi:hypothetical protein
MFFLRIKMDVAGVTRDYVIVRVALNREELNLVVARMRTREDEGGWVGCSIGWLVGGGGVEREKKIEKVENKRDT